MCCSMAGALQKQNGYPWIPPQPVLQNVELYVVGYTAAVPVIAVVLPTVMYVVSTLHRCHPQYPLIPSSINYSSTTAVLCSSKTRLA